MAVRAKKVQPAWTLTPEVIAKLVKYFREGLPIQTACELALVPYSKFKWWSVRGLQWLNSEGKDEDTAVYGQFLVEVRQAQAYWKRKMALRAAKKNSPTWVQPVTLLERRDRRHYGHKEPEGGTVEQANSSELFR